MGRSSTRSTRASEADATDESPSPLADLRFGGEWRRYQQLALVAFDDDVAHARANTHIVAPPGSGKTLLGLEIVRRLGARALVLAPNSAVQAQWLAAAARFGPAGAAAAGSEPGAAIACLTYQSLCRLDDPGAALDGLAAGRWAAERAKATGQTPEQAAAEGEAWTGEAARRRRGELSRITATLKRQIARGERPAGDTVAFADLFAPAARARIAALKASGVATVVLDECHHLASLWGYVVREALEALGTVHLVGLTATPPDELTTEEAELYDGLLGPVDFTVPTPAVVRDGYLAPYQELAWLTSPLPGELQWLAEHETRFKEITTSLLDEPQDGSLSFPGWVITRVRSRERGEGEDGTAELSWAAFHRRSPRLARAAARFLGSAGLALPPDAPRGEDYRRAPELDDWLVLLEDYALRCLAADPSPVAAARHEAIAAALRDLGYVLTRQGIRRGASDVERLLASSASKPLGLVEVLACEADARGTDLRALVLADAEVAGGKPDEALAGVLDPAAGTAANAVSSLAGDERTSVLRPLLVSGRGLRCVPADADVLLAALRAVEDVPGLAAEPVDGDGLVRLSAPGGDWAPRRWVGLATAAFTAGGSRALVGTRALLGEGWDAPCVNCLVDLTTAATGVSVRQMRGRSLRLDPGDPLKIASNWDVVCVAEAAQGEGDYRRFVRKHLHLHAPCEDGTIEAGPSHVHPALGPFAPPPETEFPGINRAMVARAAEHDAARMRWRIGEPYVGEDRAALVVRRARGTSEDAVVEGAVGPVVGAPHPVTYPVDQRTPLLGGAGVAVAAGLATVALGPVAVVGLLAAPAGLAVAARRLHRARAALPWAAPLDRVATAVAEAYVGLGELSPAAAASLRIEPRTSGYLRCVLAAATADESARFTAALDEVLGPVAAPRYLVSRLATPVGGGGQLMAALRGRPAFATIWHAVPGDFGSHKPRAEAFAAAWQRWLGPTQLVFTQRDLGRESLAQAAAQAPGWETQLRSVWV